MPWEFSNDKPIFQQLIEMISADIATGKYAPGERLDSVRDLAVSAGVNPNTMQRALSQLEQTGLLYTKRGAGRFVSENAGQAKRALDSLVRRKTGEYVDAVTALGLTKQQVRQALERELEER